MITNIIPPFMTSEVHECVCDEVKHALNDFINRECEYYYAPSHLRKLFTAIDREDFIRNPDKQSMSLNKYISVHDLEHKWFKLHIRETFSYKQEYHFRNSNLTLNEYIEKHNLCEYTLTDIQKEELSFIESDYDLIRGDDGETCDNVSDEESTGWGD